MLWLWITLGVAGFLLLVAIFIYNGLVGKKLKVDNNFSQIKIQCKKRFDLVPNLVESVKGYAKHEKETLEKVVSARNMGAAANTPHSLAAANNRLTQTLGHLFALGESYPALQASTNFKQLQDELSEIEKAIAISRGFYNDTVMMYNRAVKIFPNNIFAGLFRFKAAEFFDTSENEQQNVKVSI